MPLLTDFKDLPHDPTIASNLASSNHSFRCALDMLPVFRRLSASLGPAFNAAVLDGICLVAVSITSLCTALQTCSNDANAAEHFA